jgi:sulfur-oxidizing protein SoxA
MRFPEAARLAAALLAIAAMPHAMATADAVKADVAARLKAQLPSVAPTDYPLGAAAFDAEWRAKSETEAGAASAALETGKKMWNRKFRNGKTLASCFPNGGRRIAAGYPQYDPRLKRVVTLEMTLNQCLKANGEPIHELADGETMGVLTAYLRSLSDGQKVNVRVPAAAEDRFEEGRRLYFTRMGQRNFACASCHVQSAGKRYAEAPLSPAIGQATHWPVIREGRAVTLQARIRECLELMGAAPFAAGSDELNHIEYFLAYLSNGLPLKANVGRPRESSRP